MATVTFKPKAVVKHLLLSLPKRAKEVVVSRYGLGSSPERMTLESIGNVYKITRERVRQIENYAFATIRKSDLYKKERAAFAELEASINALGGVVPEREFLEHLSKDKGTQNHFHFLLVLGDSFKKKKEDEDFHHRWYVSPDIAEKVENSLKKLYQNMPDDSLIPESEMISSFLDTVKDVSEQYKNEEIAKRWLSLSKKVAKNPLGEWGVASSSNVRAKGMRDFAYLAIRRHGSPMHFSEVARAIQKLFDRKAHTATCHNELIKDPRFVLVGRGLYALAEWGYSSGVVKDVVREVLKKHGPLSKEQIIEKVLKERYVKPNTVLVNLQNQNLFKKSKDGRYSLVA